MDTSGYVTGRGTLPYLVGLFVACVFVPVVLGTKPTIVLDSTTSYIRRHSTVELKCYITGLAEYFFQQQGNSIAFQWEVNSVAVFVVGFRPGETNKTDERYQVLGRRQADEDRYLVSLTIPNNIEDDAGLYQCGVVIAGTWQWGSASQTIEWMQPAPPEYPRCDANTDTRTGNIKMKCTSPGNPAPTLIWHSGNDTISTSYTDPYGGKMYQNVITVNATDVRSSYECRYQYSDGGETDERSCWIGKPVLTMLATTDDATYMTGEKVQIIVVAHAQPQMLKPMQCTWNFGGDKTEFLVRNESNEMTTITIANVKPEMSGSLIKCSGYNFLGETSAAVTLLVEDIQEENLTASITTEDLRVTVGDSVTLHCELGFTPPVSDVNIDWYYDGLKMDTTNRVFKDRFNITEPRRQLVLTFATTEDHESEISCRVRFGNRAVRSREFRILVRHKPAALQSSTPACPYSLESPVVVIPVFFCVLGVLACIFILFKLLCVLCRRRRNRSQSLKIEHVGEAEMRTSSFGSSVGSEHHFERADIVVSIPDKSGLLKRTPSLPSSRCLPSVPRSSALTPVHEYESTPRNETYSLIKPDMRAEPPKCPNESNQQAYMDMGRNNGKNSDLPSDYLAKIPPPDDLLSQNNDTPRGAVGGTAPPLPLEGPESPDGSWYLEVKKTPDQFNDLEDLYRETARNNVYIPSDK